MTNEKKDEQKDGKFSQMLAVFKKLSDDADVEGQRNIALLGNLLAEIESDLKRVLAGSPQYYEDREMRRLLNLEMRIQQDRILNAKYHYLLALQMANTVNAILKDQSPTPSQESTQLQEQIRKIVNQQLAKAFADVYSDKGHEAMYGHG